MDDQLLEKLQAIDPSILTDVVRQAQRDPAFKIISWSVRRLSDKGIINPDGLWLFSGEGENRLTSQPWSVVLKIIERPESDAPLSDLWYWKREVLWAQSGYMQRLPGPVKAPRFYKVEETADGAWLWQEHVMSQRPDPWTLDDYAFAARQLGHWNGAYLCGTPLPNEPWFTRQHYRSWYTKTNPEEDFEFPLNQKYIHGELRDRYEALWADREKFYSALERLPQTFSHFDSQRRNLFIRTADDGEDELVLVDWALCGYGPLGAEMFSLIGMSAALLESHPYTVAELDQAAFESYLQGIVEAGWSGDSEVIRLGYTAWMAVWLGVVFPNITALWCIPDSRPYAMQQFGFTEEELFLKWLPILSYSLDCGDESRALMQKLF